MIVLSYARTVILGFQILHKNINITITKTFKYKSECKHLPTKSTLDNNKNYHQSLKTTFYLGVLYTYISPKVKSLQPLAKLVTHYKGDYSSLRG